MNRACLPALLFVLALAPAASGLRVRALTTGDLVREAAVVLRGRVTETRATWNERHDQIVTDASVEVLEVLVGRAPAAVTVRQLGGAIGETEYHVAGVRPLRAQEEVLLFLRTDGTRHYLVGFSQGSLFLSRDPAGRVVVRRETAALELVATPRAPRPLTPPDSESYDRLAGEVRRIATELGR